jgi:uncharacterized protein YoxC
MKTLLSILIIVMLIFFVWTIHYFERIIAEQAETIRILQEQVIELRSRLFEFRATLGGVG